MLEDTVIATESKMGEMYDIHPSGRYERLRSMGLLPLTVKSFSTEKGMAFLHFATWVYMSGNIERRAVQNSFKPVVVGQKELLDQLLEDHFSKMGIELRTAQHKSSSGKLFPHKDSGAFGRIMILMGLPVPPDDSCSIARKTSYDNELPHYFMKIASARPSDAKEREEKMKMMQVLSSILFADRLRIGNGERSDVPYIDLKNHKSEKDARHYAKSVTYFLNKAYPRHAGEELFLIDNIEVYRNRIKKLFSARINLSNPQIGYLATRRNPLLSISVNY